jgi:ketosteroid isomerase-like protein
MTGRPAKEIFLELFGAFSSGDEAVIRKLLAKDAVWRFPGVNGRLAGEHRGTEAIIAFLQSVRELTNETFEIALERIIAEGDMVVVMFKGSGERQGKTLSNPTCLVLRFDGGQLCEAREFVWDLAHVEAFWS